MTVKSSYCKSHSSKNIFEPNIHEIGLFLLPTAAKNDVQKWDIFFKIDSIFTFKTDSCMNGLTVCLIDWLINWLVFW